MKTFEPNDLATIFVMEKIIIINFEVSIRPSLVLVILIFLIHFLIIDGHSQVLGTYALYFSSCSIVVL